MRRQRDITIALGVVLGLTAASVPFAARAEDFLSALFGAFGARPPAPPPVAFPFREGAPLMPPRRLAHGGEQAWCVRGCDGRYFPITGPDNKTRAQSCSNFCPAGQTTLVYGDDIDDAVTEGGKPYSELPNAFRYRAELVAGCTCNGKDQVGLAPIGIDHDPTLRKGDIVTGAGGLEVANQDAGAHRAPHFSPLSRSARARYRHVPVVAAGR